jgi:hypothetical protein
MYDTLKVDFNNEYRVAICRPKGEIDTRFANQLLNFFLALEEKSEHPFNRLLDLTRVTAVVLETAEIIAFANARRQATDHMPHFRSAVIASSPDTEAAAYLYATLTRDSKINVSVFRDAAGAADWLRIPLSVAAPSLAAP